MKKKNIVLIIVIFLILLSIASFVVYKFIEQKTRSYEIAEVKEYNYFVLKNEEQYGVMDKEGNKIIEPKYIEVKIPNPEKPVFICYKEDNTTIVLNEKQEEILTKYNNVEPIRLKNITSELMYEKSTLTFVENEKMGLIDFDGNILAKAEYEEIDSLPHKEGELIVKQNEKFGIININGSKVIDIKYDRVEVDGYYTENRGYLESGYIVAIKTEEGYRYGYIDKDGKEIEKTEFNELSRLTAIEDKQNIYLICAKNGKYGLKKNGEEIIKNDYQNIRFDENNKLLIVEKGRKSGVINLEGKEVIPVKYNQIDITGKFLYAKDDEKTTVFDKDGKKVEMDENIEILDTENENYKIKIDNKNGSKYGVIGKNDNIIIAEKYNYLKYLYESYFIVSNENSKLGVIDEKEKILIEMENDSLQKIQDTDLIQTTISNENLTKIYSKQMEVICEMNNAIIEKNDEYIKVFNEKETKYFNKDGIELKNTEVLKNNKLFSIIKDGKWGFADINGNTVIECKYERATEFNKYGFASVEKDGKWGVVNQEGKEIVEPKYKFKDTMEPSFIGKYYQVKYGYGEIYYTDEIK